MKASRRTILAAAVSMAVMAAAQAAPISFDTNGIAAGGATFTNIGTFDWSPGTALAVGAVPITTVGQQFTLLYQANLATINDATSGLPVWLNGSSGGQYFTAVAGFREVVTSVGVSGATFGLAAGSPNFFKICAQSTPGVNLAGTGFACGASNTILSGTVTAVNSSNFSISDTTGVLLDQSGSDDWSGQLSVTGSGATDITVQIGSYDANYFTDLNTVVGLIFSFFNSSQVVPFKQVDPSKAMSSDGTLDGNYNVFTGGGGGSSTLGTVNGLFGSGPDFIFQADANQSFLARVPEPASLALLGMALGAFGLSSRRRSRKAA